MEGFVSKSNQPPTKSHDELKDNSIMTYMLPCKVKHCHRGWVNQPVHSFLGGKGLGIQQGTSV